MELVQAKSLTKSFKDGSSITEVLKGVDLSVQSGEFVSITGASGTGKSTLIYQIGLLDNPTGGVVRVEGRDASTFSVKERTAYRLNKFGFVFQDYALIPELNVWENIALPTLMRGSTVAEAKQRACSTLKKLGMADRMEHTPSQISGGESQRVSIARAILHDPAIVYADEPTANLDTERSRQVIDIFHELHKAGQTIIMVTHEIEYAEEAARVIHIADGKINSDRAGKAKR